MPCLQPKIMIVYGLYKDGPHTHAIRAQGIRKDLIAHQRALTGLHLKHIQALPDTLGKRLLRVGDTGNAVFTARLNH